MKFATVALARPFAHVEAPALRFQELQLGGIKEENAAAKGDMSHQLFEHLNQVH